MKALFLIAAILMSVSAHADVQPISDVNFLDWQNEKVILQDLGNKILLGELTIDEMGTDSFVLPRCIFGDNKPVSQIRFIVKKADVQIDKVKVTFQNGKTQNILVNNEYGNGEKTEWFALVGLKDRCIQKVRVIGEVVPQWNPPHGPGGHIGFNKNKIDIEIGIGIGGPGKPGTPGHHPHPHPSDVAVLQVIGLKN